MKAQFWAAIRVLLVLTVITGIVYPLASTVAAETFFSARANGSLVHSHGSIVGSNLLGQQFSDSKYFHPRPSAAGDGYDATASAASNLGPTNKQLLTSIDERAKTYRQENNLAPNTSVPVDAVTASGSGLDPDISIANALLQAPRIAATRGLSVETVNKIVRANTSKRPLGILGESTVNVLSLNVKLDSLR